MSRISQLTFIVAVAVTLAACGDDGGVASEGDQEAIRTVEVDMVDIAFEPDQLEASAGETVRFVFTNRGELPHDAYIGDAAAQDDHAAEMADNHGDGHADEGVIVEPGETAEIVHTFSTESATLIGCHQPGHYEAGMVTAITVT